jgi:hypothetical protein
MQPDVWTFVGQVRDLVHQWEAELGTWHPITSNLADGASPGRHAAGPRTPALIPVRVSACDRLQPDPDHRRQRLVCGLLVHFHVPRPLLRLVVSRAQCAESVHGALTWHAHVCA